MDLEKQVARSKEATKIFEGRMHEIGVDRNLLANKYHISISFPNGRALLLNDEQEMKVNEFIHQLLYEENAQLSSKVEELLTPEENE